MEATSSTLLSAIRQAHCPIANSPDVNREKSATQLGCHEKQKPGL